MRISEWSSDVCSSDLSTYKALFDQPSQGDTKLLHGKQRFFRGLLMPVSQKLHDPVDNGIGFQCEPHTAVEPGGFRIEGTWQAHVENDFRAPYGLSDRKSTRLNSSH